MPRTPRYGRVPAVAGDERESRMLADMPDTQARLSELLADITTRLVTQRDNTRVLGLVTAAAAELLGADATGVMLAAPQGGLRVVVASDERARFIELLQSQTDEGPCVECVRDNVIVAMPDVTAQPERWPTFAPVALAAGYRAAHAIPLSLDGRAVGGLNLLHFDTVSLTDWQLRLGQALADLAVLGLVQEPEERRVDRFAERTMTTLNDRVLIGQAIGLIAGSLDISPDDARAVLNSYTDRTGHALREVARAITYGALAPSDVATDRDTVS